MRALIGKILLWFIIGAVEVELGKEALKDFGDTMRGATDALRDIKKRLGLP